MTRRANARIAGLAFLLYIAFGITAMVLLGRATSAPGIEAKLALIAQHSAELRIGVLMVLLSSFCALFLGVTLWAITRDQDRDLAMLAMTFRIGEGVVGALSTNRWLSLLWLATATGATAPSPEAAQGLGAYLLHGQSSAAMFFGIASLIFSWLILKGRMIPMWLAWLGFLASIEWVLVTPLQAAGVVRGTIVQLVTYIPMAAYEIPLALWLIFKGAALPARSERGA